MKIDLKSNATLGVFSCAMAVKAADREPRMVIGSEIIGYFTDVPGS